MIDKSMAQQTSTAAWGEPGGGGQVAVHRVPQGEQYDGAYPPAPSPGARLPDIALQLHPPEKLRQITPADLEAIRISLRNEWRTRYPNAQVSTSIVDVHGRRVPTIGIWTEQSADEAENQRTLALQRIQQILTDDWFAFRIDAAFLRRETRARVTEELNKRGKTDARGRLRLDSTVILPGTLRLTLQSPDTLTLSLDGYDTKPMPDLPFTIHLEDQLATKLFLLTCESRVRLEKKAGKHRVLSIAAALGAAAAALSFLVLSPVIALALFGVAVATFAAAAFQAATISGAQPPPMLAGGVGRKLVETLPSNRDDARGPRPVPIPGEARENLNFLYTHCEVHPDAVTAGGILTLTPRNAQVWIDGTDLVEVEPGETSASLVLRARSRDMREPAYRWVGEGSCSPTHAAHVNWEFALPKLKVGESVTREVAVEVEDADGMSATARLRITIVAKQSKPEPLSPRRDIPTETLD